MKGEIRSDFVETGTIQFKVVLSSNLFRRCDWNPGTDSGELKNRNKTENGCRQKMKIFIADNSR
jgi:hypothetical protein